MIKGRNLLHMMKFYMVLLSMIVGMGMLFAGQSDAVAQTEFDHFSTGFPLEGQHKTLECESCHVNGVFKGTPKDCISCHDRAGGIGASERPISHIRTRNECEDCHTTFSWESLRRMDHGSALGSCESCHDGQLAPGKNPTHVQSGNNCEDCHITLNFTNAVFDHSNTDANCASCHNGTIAPGKNTSHILTSLLCESCHTVNGWQNIVRVDHNEVVGTCFSCHNGSIAGGK
ncbi:MAG: hypothetical protein L3J50_06030, partial [Emcibacter sp.]|nr:hypothetical protein [Emcibacter sp.]